MNASEKETLHTQKAHSEIHRIISALYKEEEMYRRVVVEANEKIQ